MKDDIDRIIKEHLPSLPEDQRGSNGPRTLEHLRSIATDDDNRTDEADFEPVPLPRWATVRIASAVAAVLVAGVIASVLWQSSERLAIVERVDGTRESIEAGGTVRTNGGVGAMLALADGSRVEMRSQSELSLERAADGVRIRLNTGGIIVNAAKQRDGHLYVQTRDMTVSVVGTVFLVNTEADGSRVAVIEGEVRVHEGTNETKLTPGQQVATSSKLESLTVKEEISWSRQAETHLALLSASAPAVSASMNQTTSGAQTPARPEFEEASIRLCQDGVPQAVPGMRGGGGVNSFQMTPGRTRADCMTLAALIRQTYGLDLLNNSPNPGAPERGGRGLEMNSVYGLGMGRGNWLRGAPDWVRNDQYTIEAVADGAATAETMQGPMLRALLEKRFQLKLHVEVEQAPSYALTVARGGLKIKPMPAVGCADAGAAAARGEPLNRTRWPMFCDVTCTASQYDELRAYAVAVHRAARQPLCGSNGASNGTNALLVFGGSPVGALIDFRNKPRLLEFGVIDESVVRNRAGAAGIPQFAPFFDRTGIDDLFNFMLEFGREPNRAPPGLALPEPDLARRPNFFIALEEQLGLKLEPIKIPTEFIVVDRVERPSPN